MTRRLVLNRGVINTLSSRSAETVIRKVEISKLQFRVIYSYTRIVQVWTVDVVFSHTRRLSLLLFNLYKIPTRRTPLFLFHLVMKYSKGLL